MKILLIHNYYQQHGGEDTVFTAEMELLIRNGHKVIPYVRKNIEIIDYVKREKIQFIGNSIWSKRTEKEILDICDRERPDVAHIHNIFPLISPSVYDALHKAGIPIVQTLHNFRFLCPNGLFFRKGKLCEKCKNGNTYNAVIHKCYHDNYFTSALYATSILINRIQRRLNHVRIFIALSTFAAEKYKESKLIPEEKIVILGNFIENPIPEKAISIHPERKYAVFIGRLSNEKGLVLLLKTFHENPNIELRIVGTGPEENQLKKYIEHHKITNIHFEGHLDHRGLLEIAKHAFVTVIPSECYETFGVVALESMSVATPVIAARIGSLPDIVEDGKSGYLFEPKNSQELKEKVIRLFTHPQEVEQMGAYAQSVVRERFGPEIHYQKLLDIYRLAAS